MPPPAFPVPPLNVAPEPSSAPGYLFPSLSDRAAFVRAAPPGPLHNISRTNPSLPPSLEADPQIRVHFLKGTGTKTTGRTPPHDSHTSDVPTPDIAFQDLGTGRHMKLTHL